MINTGMVHWLFCSTQYAPHRGDLDKPNLTPCPGMQTSSRSPGMQTSSSCIQCKHRPVGIHLVQSYHLLGSMFHLISIATQLIPRRLLPPSGSSELSSRDIRTGNSRAQGPVHHSLIIRMGQGGWGARWNPKGPSHENQMEYEGGGGRMLLKVQDH